MRSMFLVVCLTVGLLGCHTRGLHTRVSITSAGISLPHEPLADKTCLYISSLTPTAAVVTLVMAHDGATLEECLAYSPPPRSGPPRLPGP